MGGIPPFPLPVPLVVDYVCREPELCQCSHITSCVFMPRGKKSSHLHGYGFEEKKNPDEILSTHNGKSSKERNAGSALQGQNATGGQHLKSDLLLCLTNTSGLNSSFSA